MKISLLILVLLFLKLAPIDAQTFASEGKVLPGEIKLTAKAIHPFFRTDAFPSNGMVVDVNPVCFYWPSDRNIYTMPLKHYDFQLSLFDNFSVIEEQAKAQNPSFYVAQKVLKPGVWYWRFREAGGEWSVAFRFFIDNTTRIDKRPSAKQFVNLVKGDHPRMVVRKERLPFVRDDFSKRGITGKETKDAEKYFNVALPDYEWGGKFYRNGKRVFQPSKFPEEHVKSKITSNIWNDAIVSLCRSYLLTGDEKYAKEALRWGMKVATFKIMPNELTYENNPYPDGFCFAFYLNSMAHVYDCLFDYMNETERGIILENIAERLRIYYEYYCNRLENRCIDNHSWQLSIASFARAAIATKGDIQEVDQYLEYLYNIWTARDPEQSHTDGGWFGGGYVGVNIDVWLEVPAYFRMFTGYNYYDHPFYWNHPYYFLYRQAPGSNEDGFSGDGYGGDSRYIGEKMKVWMDVLGADLNHPVADYLSKSFKTDKPIKFNNSAWIRLTEGMPSSSPAKMELPNLKQSRTFSDIGVVNMHTDLLNPENDLHVALRSSPYGTFGHNLASHNAFNIIYKGDYLFVPYGHRHGGAKNNAACYRHTRGHNSVLIDGKGQPFSPEAYGWIARSLDGEKISYACGDASKAYDADPFERETELFASAGLNISDHISRGQMSRFRRHVVLIRPSLVLVYDELEASEPVGWDWVLHCRKNMISQGLALSVEGVEASVEVKASSPMTCKIHDKPMFMPVNVDGRGGGEAGADYPVLGRYAYVSTTKKTDKLRLLSIIQVGQVSPVLEKGDNKFSCGDWEIEVVMDPKKMANLKISSKVGSSSFMLKDSKSGESVIREVKDGKAFEIRTVDQLPYQAKGLTYESNIVE